MPTDLAALAAQVGERLSKGGHRLATAESCTGGLIAAVCTDLAGSSDWFDCALVTYTLDAKMRWLGVDPSTLERHGAVSEPVAKAMVLGVLARSRASHAVAVTGIAGPSGGEPGIPVGSVWFAWAVRAGDAVEVAQTSILRLEGDRGAVRRQAVAVALDGVLRLTEPGGP